MARSGQLLAPRRFSPKKVASTSARPILANSEGWRFIGPRSIQRRAPPRDDAEQQHVDEQRGNAEVDQQRVLRQRAVVDRQAHGERHQAQQRPRRAACRTRARRGRAPRRTSCCRSSTRPTPASSRTAPSSSQSMWRYRRRSNMATRSARPPGARRTADGGAGARPRGGTGAAGAARSCGARLPGTGQRPAFLLGEVGVDDVLGDRRGQVAVLGVLGEDHAGDLRVVARREEHEPAVVAQVACRCSCPRPGAP